MYIDIIVYEVLRYREKNMTQKKNITEFINASEKTNEQINITITKVNGKNKTGKTEEDKHRPNRRRENEIRCSRRERLFCPTFCTHHELLQSNLLYWANNPIIK